MSVERDEAALDSKEPGRRAIFFLIKVFTDGAHADAFLDGKLWCNRLSYFKGIEDPQGQTRGDPFEGVVTWRQPGDIKLTVTIDDTTSFDINQLAAPFQVEATVLNDVHLFCLYAAHSDHLVDVVKDGSDVIGGSLRVPMDLAKFGEHVVLVQAGPFIDRVAATIKGNRHWGTAGLVEYYDPEMFSGEFTPKEALLRKRKEFDFQSEYRFAFNAETRGTRPHTLQVGSLRDIAWRLSGDDLRGGITLNLTQKAPA
ncbi:hypothetical protein HDE76_000288 [Rhodanobacter sp. ANJX3]|uniref:hypothetical protein n=1 Tax=Rhodanobacter sp. ANJX3 TaxID=2723083 RepID=UPI001612A907|nr:hypothetical protein [Rhodanobacter sp. ANJX3]MBB5357106.1 hypothetical protein [Rhodanobacter sp. ANJX3]